MDMKMLWTASVAAVIAALTLVGCSSTGGQSLPSARPGAATSTNAGSGPAPASSTGTSASSQPQSPATTGAGSMLTVGKLTLRAPTGWRITASDGKGDYAISTTACDASDDVWGASCPAVLVLTADKPGFGGAGIGIGSEGQSPYNPSHPYHPSSGVLPCPQYPNSAAVPGSSRRGFAPVAGRTANYTVWPFTCNNINTGAHLGSFEQRDWYLPVSKVLIVDQYQTPGVAAILKDAALH
jgi:hypothetical protein